MIYDDDADLSKLDGKTVAILGYGSRATPTRSTSRTPGSTSSSACARTRRRSQKAEADGLEVVSIADAASRGDVVMVLLPDEKQDDIWESEISDGIAPGNLLLFAHGFAIHYDQIDPGPGVDVGMVAPKGPGHLVRRQYTEGNGRARADGHPRRTRAAPPATWCWPTPRASAAPAPA